MYSSRPCGFEEFSPWKQHRWTKRVHEENPSTSTPQNGHNTAASTHAAGLHALAQESGIPQEAMNFSPPLAAYLSETCGPNLVFAQYNRDVQLAALSGRKDVLALSPQNLARLDAIRRVRAAGYTTIAPLGVNRTMAQIHFDDELEEEDSQAVHAENSGTANGSTAVTAESPAQIYPDNGGAPLLADLDRDLDAGVADADASDMLESSGAGELTTDAFMAEEMEYQDDHSLDIERDLANSGLESSALATAAPSGPNTAMASSASTAATTVETGRACDDSDMDMMIEG